MRHKRHTIIILLMLAVSLSIGCDKEPPKPQSVVINIHTIAETTGINEDIKMLTEIMSQQISEDMKALTAASREKIENEKAGFGDSPSEEDKKKLQTLQGQLRKQFMEARNEKNTRLKEVTSEVRQAYVDNIMSIAQIIALEHGASIILKANSVFWSEGAVDITDEVIKQMPDGKDGQAIESDAKDEQTLETQQN